MHAPQPPRAPQPAPQADGGPAPSIARLAAGGALMGLANLVPGISGGTMLVAAGVYRAFIDAIADVTRLRPTRRGLVGLVVVASAAGGAIVLGAAPVALGLEHARWAMYSLFIGLTLGGAPSLWAMLRPLDGKAAACVLVGIVGMVLVVVAQESGASGASGAAPGGSGWPLLVLAGVAGASAMVLPGISGAYLLLLLGQYEAVVGAIKALPSGDRGALLTLVPVGVGVGVGIVGVANALRWLLHRYERPTLAVLLGLLVGAPAGLYPFRTLDAPAPTRATQAAPEAERVPEPDPDPAPLPEPEPTLRAFTPTPWQVAGSAGLVALGAGVTLGVARLGRTRER